MSFDFTPRPVVEAPNELVHYDVLDGATPIRLITPAEENLDILAWASANQTGLLAELQDYGAVLFRGFDVSSIDQLRSFAKTFSPELLPYVERRSPRTELGDNIYTSTIHPADQYIHFHNTTSFSHQWPQRLWFCCIKPAEWEGRTPIADCRKVLSRIDEEVRREFIEKGVLYVSNYHEGIGLSWQTTFQTTNRAVVEKYCEDHGIEYEWVDGVRLRTKSRRHAVVRHPHTGELSWFNQAHHYHIASLEPEITEALTGAFAEEDLPRHAYFGDGSPIEKDVLEHIYSCYEKNENSFLWETGDVILLDNMLVAHSRTPYRGERLIALAIAELYHVPDGQSGGVAEPIHGGDGMLEAGD